MLLVIISSPTFLFQVPIRGRKAVHPLFSDLGAASFRFPLGVESADMLPRGKNVSGSH